MPAIFEHTNLTVSNPDATAALLSDLFDWHVRWSGPAINGGRTVHVGSDSGYLALFTPKTPPTQSKVESYDLLGGLNHVAVIVEDLDATETAVKAAGFTPVNHADYEPGRRFYFHDSDGIEYEIVSYS